MRSMELFLEIANSVCSFFFNVSQIYVIGQNLYAYNRDILLSLAYNIMIDMKKRGKIREIV